MCTLVCQCPWRSEEGFRFSGPVVIGLNCHTWVLGTGLWQAPLNAEGTISLVQMLFLFRSRVKLWRDQGIARRVTVFWGSMHLDFHSVNWNSVCSHCPRFFTSLLANIC